MKKRKHVRNLLSFFGNISTERQQPAQNYFLFLHRNVGEFGSFGKPKKYGTRPPNENEPNILQALTKLQSQKKKISA